MILPVILIGYDKTAPEINVRNKVVTGFYPFTARGGRVMKFYGRI